jgi:GDP dissociation inhibitor
MRRLRLVEPDESVPITQLPGVRCVNRVLTNAAPLTYAHAGGDCASLNLTNLYQKFKPGTDPPPFLGHPTRDYNVDLIPKFIMGCGNLVKMLLYTKVRPLTSSNSSHDASTSCIILVLCNL